MAAEVYEVEGAEFAGDVNDAHVVRGAGEDGNTIDIRAGEVKPEVGDRGVGLRGVGGVLIGVDQMLPACGVVGGDDGTHRLGDIEGRLGVAVVVNAEMPVRAAAAWLASSPPGVPGGSELSGASSDRS